MIPSDVRSAKAIGSDREVSGVVMAAQRYGAGCIGYLQRAGITDADICGIDTNQVDRIAKGEAGHGAAELRHVIELQRGRRALKGDNRPGRDRRGKLQQTSAVDRKRAETCGGAATVKASRLNLQDSGVADGQNARCGDAGYARRIDYSVVDQRTGCGKGAATCQIPDCSGLVMECCIP